MGLTEYQRKRRFNVTPEPAGDTPRRRDSHASDGLQFVIQKHAASRLHYDFRLELDGVLKSWAVPKGPSLDPDVKSLAVHVEDHPMEYGSFEGTIPKNEYGGGTVLLWDRGTWEPEGDPQAAYRRGKLKFALHGEKLAGRWALIRMSGSAGENGKNWLLKKVEDSQAEPNSKTDVLTEKPRSVASGRTMDEIAESSDRVWTSGRSQKRTTKNQAKKSATSGTAKKSSRAKSTRASAKGLSPSDLPGAVRRKLPKTFKPQLTTPVDEVPEGDEWLHELKFDGYRLLARIHRGKPQLITRRGIDWSAKFPGVVEALRALQLKSAMLDGEVVVLSPEGISNFQALQNVLQHDRADDLVYYVFDIPFCEGYDLTQVPLRERKEFLRSVVSAVGDSGMIRFSDHITGSGVEAFKSACRRGLEGLICKRAQSPYQQVRSADWVKVKCLQRQELVIAGWTPPGGARTGFGALLLGYYDDEDRFVYAGRVGTGFTRESLEQLKTEVEALEQDDQPFAEPLRGTLARDVHWVKPKLVAEISFAEWTADGRLRAPSFQGLREDKLAKSVHRERPRSRDALEADGTSAKDDAAAGRKKSKRAARAKTSSREKSESKKNSAAKKKSARSSDPRPAGVRLTNPGRVIYPAESFTKLDLAEYYVAVADWILPQLIHRPLTLVRCPRGQGGHCFYQKHLIEGFPEPVRGIDVSEKKGNSEWYVAVDDLPGLVTLVQMSALEIHPWGSCEDRLDHPDRMILDLDPGPGVEWEAMVEAAREVREILTAAGLESFVRTTGGKGLHVVTPLDRSAPWKVVKGFAHAIAQFLARHAPARYIAVASKAKRKGKIYVDYLRNNRGATAIASYSSRARPGAPVAVPLRWDELSPQLDPAKWTIKTVPERMRRLKKDPWDGIDAVEQRVTADLVKKLT